MRERSKSRSWCDLYSQHLQGRDITEEIDLGPQLAAAINTSLNTVRTKHWLFNEILVAVFLTVIF